ncbi:MMPL family transporter [Hydromonas duriensis]|uniref:Putative exporter n=1 Tax=Hydromonas duriensis TaxID=1527608 RepID=A0A4R6Y6M4_9BURK|nr:MMPL family transporter [Hydromonas duriensis]TDR30751.1 putative exporter [Hydromonas duriensis]
MNIKPNNNNSWQVIVLIFSAVLMLGVLGFKWPSSSSWISKNPLTLLPHGYSGLSPQDQVLLEKAQQQQRRTSEKQIILLFCADKPEQAENALNKASQILEQYQNIIEPSKVQNPEVIQSIIDFYSPHVYQLLTDEQKQKIQNQSDQEWIAEVKRNSLMPFSVGLSSADDPFANLQTWLLHQSKKTAVYQGDTGHWETEFDGKKYQILFYQSVDEGLSLDANSQLLDILEQIKHSIAQDNSNVLVHMAGIPLHVAAATKQANYEVSLFGSISTVAVLILLWLAYRSIRATLAVTLSLAYGMLLAFFVTLFVFGEVHILTLVFGTSLIGVAEDFGFHFLAARQNMRQSHMAVVKKHIAPGMFFAFSTTILSYLFLGFPPFPALRQIAVFSATGITGAAAFVWVLFPLLFKQMGEPTQLNKLFARSWRVYIHLAFHFSTKAKVLAGLGFVLLIVISLSRLTFKDDLRQLQNSPQWLLEEQRLVGQVLRESNSQFLLITAPSEQQLLEKEEQLRSVLEPTLSSFPNIHYRAISEWIPSIQRQRDNETIAIQKFKSIKDRLGLTKEPIESTYITPTEALSQPFAAILKSQWLGEQTDGRWASVVNILGPINASQLKTIENSTQKMDGVIWVDSVAQYSQLLAKYRNIIITLLILSYLATWFLLRARYNRHAWLILLPPALSSLLTLVVLSWLGISVQLFTVLPLLLVLGMGVDYGIFLVEHVKEQEKMWMVTCLSTISTILSLGMLGFSQTPALHVLGLSLGLGVTFSCVLAAFVGKYVAKQKLLTAE